eukprot:683564-Heterocapsa_arctica.AAC.1
MAPANDNFYIERLGHRELAREGQGRASQLVRQGRALPGAYVHLRVSNGAPRLALLRLEDFGGFTGLCASLPNGGRLAPPGSASC